MWSILAFHSQPEMTGNLNFENFLQMFWLNASVNRDGELESLRLLDLWDEEAGREENSSPTFDLHDVYSQ